MNVLFSKGNLILETDAFNYHFHWSLAAPLLMIFNFTTFFFVNLLLIVGIYAVIAVHVLGHALACKLLGVDVEKVVLHLFGGYCEHEGVERINDKLLISCGGIAAQAVLLISGILLTAVSYRIPVLYALFFGIFCIFNLLIAGLNFIPRQMFDGWYIRSIMDFNKTKSSSKK